MDLKTFLDSLAIVALSPYALVGYALVVIAWGCRYGTRDDFRFLVNV